MIMVRFFQLPFSKIRTIIIGGMDVYIREFNAPRTHDQFYVNETLINAFKNYTTQIVSRYVNSPAIFAW